MFKEDLIDAIRQRKAEELQVWFSDERVISLTLNDRKEILQNIFQNSECRKKISEIYNEVSQSPFFVGGLTQQEITLLKVEYFKLSIVSATIAQSVELKLRSKKCSQNIEYLFHSEEQKSSGAYGFITSLFGIILGSTMILSGILSLPTMTLPLIIAGVLVGVISTYGLAASSYSLYQVFHNERVSSHTENASLGLLKPDAKEPVRTNETAHAL